QQSIGQQLGLAKLYIVQALPILLAGIGFSRYFASPQGAGDGDRGTDVKLRPFEVQGGKIPIYVARNTTEALLYELDPWRVAAFLASNVGTEPPQSAKTLRPAMRAWLLSQGLPMLSSGESHFELKTFERTRGVQIHESTALLF